MAIKNGKEFDEEKRLTCWPSHSPDTCPIKLEAASPSSSAAAQPTGGRLLSSSRFCDLTDRAAAKDRTPWMSANSAKNIILEFQFRAIPSHSRLDDSVANAPDNTMTLLQPACPAHEQGILEDADGGPGDYYNGPS
jgi:hypothetical protein